MENQIQALLPIKNIVQPVTIFAYASKGIPGIEIHGVGKHAKTIKEKFVYLSRIRKLDIPLRKFVICLEENSAGGSINWNDIRWLEFPMLLLYWSMAGVLPIHNLNKCVASGFISASGVITHPDFKIAKYFSDNELKCITTNSNELEYIDSKELFQNIPEVKFIKWIKPETA